MRMEQLQLRYSVAYRAWRLIATTTFMSPMQRESERFLHQVSFVLSSFEVQLLVFITAIVSGAVTTLAGGLLYVNGVGTMSSFRSLVGLAVDVNGAMHTYDSSIYNIRKTTSAG